MINIIEGNIVAVQTVSNKKVVFTFGRMNPPTKGHSVVFDVVLREATECDYFIFPSLTCDSKRNPLCVTDKIMFLRELFPDVTFTLNYDILSPFHAFDWLVSKGYRDIIFVVGSDRVEEFNERLGQYAGKYTDSFRLVVAGTERGNKLTAESIMSATAARSAAQRNDICEFIKATGWKPEVAKRLMAAVRSGLEEI